MITAIDDAILSFFGSIHVPWLDAVVPFISALGNGGAIWILAAVILMALRSTRRGGFTVAAALILALILCNGIIKPVVDRIRPYEAHEIILLIGQPSGSSFPSGHAASSFAAATAAAISLRDKRLFLLAFVPALLISLSRLYLQVHYFTDVLAGAAVGAAMGIAAYFIVNAVYRRFFEGDGIDTAQHNRQ